jgi:hypothetical protein
VGHPGSGFVLGLEMGLGILVVGLVGIDILPAEVVGSSVAGGLDRLVVGFGMGMHFGNWAVDLVDIDMHPAGVVAKLPGSLAVRRPDSFVVVDSGTEVEAGLLGILGSLPDTPEVVGFDIPEAGNYLVGCLHDVPA